jgi:hypothetical protein
MRKLQSPEEAPYGLPCLRFLPGQESARPDKKDRKEAKESKGQDCSKLNFPHSFINLWQTGTFPDQ